MTREDDDQTNKEPSPSPSSLKPSPEDLSAFLAFLDRIKDKYPLYVQRTKDLLLFGEMREVHGDAKAKAALSIPFFKYPSPGKPEFELPPDSRARAACSKDAAAKTNAAPWQVTDRLIEIAGLDKEQIFGAKKFGAKPQPPAEASKIEANAAKPSLPVASSSRTLFTFPKRGQSSVDKSTPDKSTLDKSAAPVITIDDDESETPAPANPFISAKAQLSINNAQRRGLPGKSNGSSSYGVSGSATAGGGGRLGPSRANAPPPSNTGTRSKFKSPYYKKEDEQPQQYGNSDDKALIDTYSRYNLSGRKTAPSNSNSSLSSLAKRVKTASPSSGNEEEAVVDERLKNIEPKLIETIMNEIMESSNTVTWDDIAGLEHAKKTIREIVVWPMLRPDIFTGLRGPPKGILLFGPPGTGKTMFGRCIASQAKATFFSISASSLTSKWVGEGEKLVRALFAIARVHQPSVIFLDEIDSLLTQRTDGEVEASRRIKTEFLVQFDGARTNGDDRILLIGATNRPHEIDEAARRRLVKRLYIPLPDGPARKAIVVSLLAKQSHNLSDSDLQLICEKTDGYSGSDMANLCREAALGPIRAIQENIQDISLEQVRPIQLEDFEQALTQVRASVSDRDLELYEKWNRDYGCLSV